ncbi:hypothetical protein CEG14_05640 [Bordetella genomosp. 1]|uniref:DUF1064 domain-containing protein n=1 Tax=Bordetella genomosp. 1 TaxID=1395607 RepID=A0A261SNQ9_9BORD|nr:DUF1064 domain-containing protein [Bordetella genomosp. 1]OZI39018.1 hypothetical protein CEG14_05640 [Bordetella genomosp. 1]
MVTGKYSNKKTVVDGRTFDSKREAARYLQLRAMERAGAISSLVLQPSFELIPRQRKADGKIERPVVYIADFAYQEAGERVIEDVKGMRTRDYIIKRKLMLERHGITVREVV